MPRIKPIDERLHELIGRAALKEVHRNYHGQFAVALREMLDKSVTNVADRDLLGLDNRAKAIKRVRAEMQARAAAETK